jgi:hypothetical protein
LQLPWRFQAKRTVVIVIKKWMVDTSFMKQKHTINPVIKHMFRYGVSTAVKRLTASTVFLMIRITMLAAIRSMYK